MNEVLLLEVTANIVSAYVSKNQIPYSEVPKLIADVSAAITRLASVPEAEPQKPVPAVNPKRSVFPDYIISLEDGRKFKSLKRHLMSTYGMSPEEYRKKWSLPPDYPMVAPSYANVRSRLAKEIGLGRKASAARKSRARPRKPVS